MSPMIPELSLSSSRIAPWPLAALLLVIALPMVELLPASRWHDQQRFGQILVITLAALWALRMGGRASSVAIVDWQSRRAIVVLAAMGVASAALARQPGWAFAELAIALGSLGLGWMVVMARLRAGPACDRAILAAVFFAGAALSLQVLVVYLAALASEAQRLDVWMLLGGFSHPRFYGQFISLTLPLLVVPLLVRGGLQRFAVPAFLVLVLWWAIAIISGTRGTWLGMAVATALLALQGDGGRRWAAWQAAGALAGFVVFWILMELIPALAEITIANHAGGRLTTSLSGREHLWQQAIDMILARPLLGFGPMHYADIANRIAAHPHQAWLQWAAEWGVPSALVVSWLVWRSARGVFRVVHERAASCEEADVLRLCLAGAMTASLTQAMVDGVLVMPYTEIWLALLAGWLLALHPRGPAVEAPPPALIWRAGWGLALIAAAAMLVSIAFRDVPQLQSRQEAYRQTFGGHFQPRFWLQGVIAEKR